MYKIYQNAFESQRYIPSMILLASWALLCTTKYEPEAIMMCHYELCFVLLQ